MSVTRLLRRALLAMFGLQLLVAGILTLTDLLRHKRGRAPTFPRTPPEPVPLAHGELTPYTYGQDLYDDMLAAIRGAERLILFESFIWKADRVGQEFKDALTEAADRGVDVFITYDGFANLVVPGRFKRFDASLHVLRYPVFAARWRFYDFRHYGRTHRKILVVDDEVAFVGGFNVGSLYADSWRDTHARITGPNVWDLKNAFVDFWNQHAGKDQPRFHDHGANVWDPTLRTFRNSPKQWVFPIRNMYLEAIDRSSRHVYLSHAYFVPDSDLLRALTDAARRGVDVRLLVPAISNHVVADWMSRGFYEQLLKGGVRIFLYQDAMIHAKTATIDGQWSTIGTANIDRLSLTGNYEINVEVYDSDVAAKLEQIFANDCSNAVELMLHDWLDRPIYKKAAEAILAPLRPLV